MSDDVIELVRAADPCPDRSAGWGRSPEGQAALQTVLGGGSPGHHQSGSRRPHWAIAAILLAATAVGAVAVATRRAGDDHVDSSRAPRTLPEGPVARDPGPIAAIDPGRTSYTVATMGDRLLFWGPGGDIQIFDPAANTWTNAADAPVPAPPMGLPVWTGSELIFWGGNDGDPEGPITLGEAPRIAYKPESDTWRTIARSPLNQERPFATAWTGTEVLYWVTSGSPAGAAYNPKTDTWRPLRSPNPGGVSDIIDASHDETLVWIYGSGLPGTDTSRPVIASYSRSDDAWRIVADPPPPGRGNTYINAKVVGDRVIGVPSLGDSPAMEWTRASGWKPIDIPSAGTGICGGSVFEVSGLPAIVRCDGMVYVRQPDGAWARAPKAPSAGILPLESGGFVTIDDQRGRVWWYR